MSRILNAAFCVSLIGWLGVPSGASAQSVCGPHAELTKALETRYSERPAAIGLGNNGAMVEVFTAPAGNWSIVMTQPNGVSCLIASGEGWERLPQGVAGVKS